jgi:hypothetical protein
MPHIDMLILVIAGSLICLAAWEWLKWKASR